MIDLGRSFKVQFLKCLQIVFLEKFWRSLTIIKPKNCHKKTHGYKIKSSSITFTGSVARQIQTEHLYLGKMKQNILRKKQIKMNRNDTRAWNMKFIKLSDKCHSC